MKVIDWLMEDSRFSNSKSYTSSKLFVLEEATLGEIYDQFYTQLIDRETFDKLALVDPTAKPDKKGKYLDWLIRKAYKKNPNILEDESKVKEDLQLFDKFGSKLGKQIGQLKDQYDLSQTVKEIREKETDLKSNKEKKKEIKLQGADKIYETDTWLILTPKTEEAACFYGKGTRWCTASTNNNMFDRYNKQGKLYIIINKKDQEEKFQLHFESQSFMDSSDVPVENITDYIPRDVIDKLGDIAESIDGDNGSKNYDWFLKVTGKILEGWNVETIARYMSSNGYLYGVQFPLDYDMMVNNYDRPNHGEGISFKIGEYGDEYLLWDAIDNHTKDINYNIFQENYFGDMYYDYEVSNNDLVDKIKENKDLFPDEESFKRAIEIVNDGEDDEQEIEGSDEIKEELITAYRDSMAFGAETDAMSDFYNAIRDYNRYGFKVNIPKYSESQNFELWVRIEKDNFNDLVSDDYYETDDIFTFGFNSEESDWFGFDDENFRSYIKRAFKL